MEQGQKYIFFLLEIIFYFVQTLCQPGKNYSISQEDLRFLKDSCPLFFLRVKLKAKTMSNVLYKYNLTWRRVTAVFCHVTP